jgi:hypothetical protein
MLVIGSAFISWEFGGSLVAFLLCCMLYLFVQPRIWMVAVISFAVSYVYFQFFIHSKWLPPVLMAVHSAWTVPMILWLGKAVLKKMINRVNLGK